MPLPPLLKLPSEEQKAALAQVRGEVASITRALAERPGQVAAE